MLEDPPHFMVPVVLVVEQGYSMNKPSEILVSLTAKDEEILRVRVGGKAMNLAEIDVEY